MTNLRIVSFTRGSLLPGVSLLFSCLVNSCIWLVVLWGLFCVSPLKFYQICSHSAMLSVLHPTVPLGCVIAVAHCSYVS
jgi:hypothetical protein